jgi:hypothetical protein
MSFSNSSVCHRLTRFSTGSCRLAVRVDRAAMARSRYEPLSGPPTASAICWLRLEWMAIASSGIPAMAQCPRRPDRPESATMP